MNNTEIETGNNHEDLEAYLEMENSKLLSEEEFEKMNQEILDYETKKA